MKYLFLVLLALLASCEKGADLENIKKYYNKEIYFNYPGNWKVTEDSESEGVRFIFIESPGAGIMKIEIYNYEDSFELNEFVKLDKKSLLDEFPKILGAHSPDLIMKTEKTIAGEKIGGLMYEIDISVLGVEIPHTTEVFEFSNDKKAAYLSGQVATEDSHLVSDGFDLIISSFKHEVSLTNNSSGTAQAPPLN